MAINHAHRVLDWQENLTSDEMPPQWMWPLDHELELWFEQVESRRDEKYGATTKDEDVSMMDNELSKGRR